jgi:superfamily II DNA or RNA helicase
LVLAKLSYRFSDIFYSYRASRTDFQAYQFKPLLKYIDMEAHGDARGLLIADEVGLGKTIEAAIIYMEAKARAALERVLVVCPAGLVPKWRSELWFRFDEDFVHLDRRMIRDFVRRYEETGGTQQVAAVISLESLRDDAIRQMLEDAAVHFDLVVVDEAHHLRNSTTKSHQVVESLANFTDRLILLTATPLQTRREDLFNLLRLVDPANFDSISQFEDQLLPNAALNRAISALSEVPPDRHEAILELHQLRSDPYGAGIVRNPAYERALERLHQSTALRVDEVVALREELALLNTLGHVYTRTRKRDVVASARRQATTIDVRLTDLERRFYDSVIEWVRERAARSGEWGALGFAIVGRERQAASCLPAAAGYFVELADDDTADLEMESSDPALDGESQGPRAWSATDELRDAAAALLADGVDSKYTLFRDALTHQLNQEPEAKILVFSFFKRTLRYLYRRLEQDGMRPIMVTGDVPPVDRAKAIEEFRLSPERHILLSSEVGAEGIDLQFAFTIFNYDLPWNPMRVEQRIGRIDRYGQERDKVFIFNLVLADTVEGRILARLYDRIQIFRQAVGDLEPILGEVINFVTQSLFERRLTPKEEEALAFEVDRRVRQQQADLRQYETRQAELMGDDRHFERDALQRVETGRFVSASELLALVVPWLAAEHSSTRMRDNDDGTWALRGDADLAAQLNGFTRRASGVDTKGRQFTQRLRAGETIPLTFDPDIASARQLVELIHARHLLVQAAVEYWLQRAPAAPEAPAALAVRREDLPAGEYSFFVYRMEVSAANAAQTLETIVLGPDGSFSARGSELLLRLLIEAEDSEAGLDEVVFAARQDTAQGIAMRMRADRQRIEQERNDALVALRSEAIARAEDVKRQRARDILARVSDTRIQRMKRREIENIEASKRTRLADLERRRDVVVSIAAVCSGQLIVS